MLVGGLAIVLVIAVLARDLVPLSTTIEKWRIVTGYWSRRGDRRRLTRALDVLDRALNRQEPQIGNADEIGHWIRGVRRSTEASALADATACADFVMDRDPRALAP